MTADARSTSESPTGTVSVVIVTYRRPATLRTNLEHLDRQTRRPDQVIVVDGSEDRETELVTGDFPFAEYVRNPRGAGNMTSSRNAALPRIESDLIAFLDDDALAEPTYIEELMAFADRNPQAALGCCRTLNGIEGEGDHGLDQIGVITRDWQLIGNFAADPGTDVKIAHGIGATMWMRRALIERLDGFREYFTGVSGVREDADVFLRATKLGAEAWFVRGAVALHVAAPQAKGRRFDLRYTHWAMRNHALLLHANLGMFSSAVWRTLLWNVFVGNLRHGRALHRRIVRTAVSVAGFVRGLLVGARFIGVGPRDPVGRFEHP
ncbi:MAG TPA: glycosyltransferase [Humibacter sp.]|nr:glycosyltransferase [Humibacter sp.]